MSKKSSQNDRKTRGCIARIIGIVVIVLLFLTLTAPKLLFFLSPAQQEAIELFNKTYFAAYNPVRDENGNFDFMRIVAVVFLILCCWAAMQIVRFIFNAIKLKNRHYETIKGLIGNVLRYGIVIFGVIFGLNMLGADVLTVIAGLGILSLVIGFGAQSLIEDIFAGLFIIFDGRFFVGDIISIDGFRGTVRSIGIVSTQISDTGGNIKIVNNSDIRTLTNLSEVSSLAVSIVSIAYGADLKKAEQVVVDCLATLPEKYPDVFPKVPTYAGVENLSESSVDLKCFAEVEEANIFSARRKMNRELKLALDAGGIEIPFPQVVVWQGKENKDQ
ncbi:MAG: mechanosensitive ion channel family protein [Eubacteriales bacterium]|nr:mechanosensitive ion channel family protein [Eubacteriales bacterium]